MLLAPLILIILGCVTLKHAEAETVTLDKQKRLMTLAKITAMNCRRRSCNVNLDTIAKVEAVKRGIDKANMDMTFYALIIELNDGQRLKVLETKNLRRI